MKTFDYERAWHQVAAPAFLALPQAMRDLYARTVTEAGHLAQTSDTSMPWPETDLRLAFMAATSADLAFAARVIYFAGYWYPASGKIDVPGRNLGATWKFSHYADQELQRRLLPQPQTGTSYKILHGAIRKCYESRDMWTWREVAPATEAGLEYVRTVVDPLVAVTGRTRQERDTDAYHKYEALPALITWPEPWAPFMNTDAFMAEESEIKARAETWFTEEEQRARHLARRNRVVAKFAAQREERRARLAKVDTEEAAMLWLFDHGWADLENVIYYDHTETFTFGWYRALSESETSTILDFISEFPYPYELKTTTRGSLKGGQG